MISLGDSIEVRMRPNILQELRECEYGSYEDHIRDVQCGWCEGSGLAHGPDEKDCPTCKGKRTVEERQPPYDKGRLHIVELIDRSKRKDRVVLQSDAEVEEFFIQASTGTFGLYHKRTLLRVYDQLRPFIREKVRTQVPRSTLGY